MSPLALFAALSSGCGSSSASSPPAGDGGASGAGADATSGADGGLEAATGVDGGVEATTGADTGTTAHDASTHDSGALDAGALDASYPPPTCSGGKRPFLLVNQCTQPVQLVVTSGATSHPCGSGNTCSPGTCNTSNGLCYWSVPDLGPTQGWLTPGATQTLCFDAPVAGQNAQWSGNLGARLGCTGQGGTCPPEPATLAEFTLADQTAMPPGTDFYDVSIINGLTPPMAMAPVAGTFAAQAGDPYSCGAPGARVSGSSLGGCDWNVQPTVSGVDQTTWARAVAPGGSACTSDADCSGSPGTACGLSQQGATFSRTCGAPLGFWTADQICGVDPGFGAPYDCASTVQNSDHTTSTVTELFECAGTHQSQSCYSNGASVDCCGCGTDSPDWPQATGPGFSCKNDNPNWQKVAEPWLAFLKHACPTAYVYPFDDATSTFTCAPPSTMTPVSYVVTLCP